MLNALRTEAFNSPGPPIWARSAAANTNIKGMPKEQISFRPILRNTITEPFKCAAFINGERALSRLAAHGILLAELSMKRFAILLLLILMNPSALAGPRDAQWKRVDEAVNQGLPQTDGFIRIKSSGVRMANLFMDNSASRMP